MKGEVIDKIVGDMPEFMLKLQLDLIAKQWLEPTGKWTHIADLDKAGTELFDNMVRVGIARKGEAVGSEGKAMVVYALKVPA